jgi:SecD/SecF fusion protein
MQNKGIVVALTLVLVLLCTYYLSFTIVSYQVTRDAIRYATDEKGIIDLARKQTYLDSIRNKDVYNFLGLTYTYKEVTENELNLGLDLQGGMHVTLEISPADILKALAGPNATDSSFQKTLAAARKKQAKSSKSFGDLFFESWQELQPRRKLASIFANSSTQGKIQRSASDYDIQEIINKEIESAIERSYIILKNRLDHFGTTSPNIQRLPGTGRIQVEIPGIDNPERVRKLLQGVAHLEFWDVMDTRTIYPSLLAINDLLVQEQRSHPSGKVSQKQNEPSLSELLTDSDSVTKTKASGLDSLQDISVSPLFSLSVPAGSFRYSVEDTAKINTILNRSDVSKILRHVRGYWGYKAEADSADKDVLQLYFIDKGFSGNAKLTGEVIQEARMDTDPQNGRPVVSMRMNAAGSRIWAKITRDASSKDPKGNVAIVLDNLVYTAPTVMGEIPNGNSEISGHFTLEEAKDLANVLQAGSLPARCQIVEEAIIGPTLGQSAQQSGLISSACGLILVIVFMVVYYSKGGWIANFALLFNIFFILGILAQPAFSATLTLPGIAGIVLTIGMAVDANVLIYERIKEEMAKGLHIKTAVTIGFQRAFASIFDSNLTALITGVFLYLFGQGPIKSFAVTLILGIVTSFFTAIYISRLVIDWLISRRDAESISFDSAIARFVKRRRSFEFISKSKLVFGISNTVILIGFVLILINGLNFGVDFKGGRSYIVSFNKPVVATDMKVALSQSFEGASTEVKNYGGNNVMQVTTSYQIEESSDEADKKVRDALISGVSKFSGLQNNDHGPPSESTFSISSSTKVGASVAGDIKNSAWKASIFSLLGIFLYILFRFNKWQYSMGAIIATIHDALFVIAAFAIAAVFGLSFEIDQIFVASLLTVIGYSVNDTVIIFDRIRENISDTAFKDETQVVNEALNVTLSRTLITSGTTLIVVLVLLIFGGEVLRGFSFALLIGVLVGTYSSIYIAAPSILYFGRPKVKIHKDVDSQKVTNEYE